MAFNRIIGDKERYIADYEPVIASLTDNTALETEAVSLRERLDELYTLTKNCIEEQARRGGDSTLTERHAQLTGRYEAAKSRLGAISAEVENRAVKRTRILAFLADLREQDALLTEFSENLFRATVDRIVVNRESEVVVEFRDGRQICVSVIGR